MNISEIQYVADSQGQTTGVLIPFPLWREIQEKLAATHDPWSKTTAWDVLDTLTGSVAAPPDWATEHDHYLYGIPKQEIANQPS